MLRIRVDDEILRMFLPASFSFGLISINCWPLLIWEEEKARFPFSGISISILDLVTGAGRY